MCQSSRQFCESAGDKGGSTPPALLLLLSRLCLDYETSTISYILTLTDEQFLVQVNSLSSYKCSDVYKTPYYTVKIHISPPSVTHFHLSFFSAPQSCNTCHGFMFRSQRVSTEATEPLCQGRFSLLMFTVILFLTEGKYNRKVLLKQTFYYTRVYFVVCFCRFRV